MKYLIASILLTISSSVLSGVLPDKPHVYVEGLASIEVVPDKMIFTVSFSEVADTVSSAKAEVDSRSRKLIEVCKDAGVDQEDIAATSLNVSPATEYKDGNRVSIGTRVSRQIEIVITNLDLYPTVMSALADADISETVDTRLSVTNEKEITDKALVAAMRDAKERAERLATAQGRKLGKAYSISEFMTRGEERYMLRVSRRIEGQASRQIHAKISSPPSEPFEVGVMLAKAEVYVVYLLK